MDPDFTALASRVAARAEVLGCVILSRDGLVLGAFPPHGEQDITPGLLRFAALGDPDRGFAEFRDELWAYVRAGAYAAFAVAEHGTRPGILLDYLEQALLVAEEARQEGRAVSQPVHVDLQQKGINAGRKLRAAASAGDEFRAAVFAPEREGENRPADVPVVPAMDDSALDQALADALATGEGGPTEPPGPAPSAALDIGPVEAEFPPELVMAEAPTGPPPAEAMEAPPAAPAEPTFEAPVEAPVADRPEHEPEHGGAADDPSGDGLPTAHANPDEIDRVALAREFAQLLQEGPERAEGGAE